MSYIGLISGTSVDSVSAVLVEFSDTRATLRAHYTQAIPSALKQQILEFIEPGDNEIDRMCQLDRQLGELFATAALNLLSKANVPKVDVIAIGSHGQNIRHRPTLATPFTLQIADPNTIAQLTGITTVADFRRKDVSLDGQGAPLAPAFHHAFMRSDKIDRIVLNLGGIANITLLPHDSTQSIIGFDTGPASGLLDAWISQEKNLPYDDNGQWAVSGTVDEELLKKLLADPYFNQAPPKSTGKEYFNLSWLKKFLSSEKYKPENIQRTLLELTAESIVRAIHDFSDFKSGEIIVCGGGVHNKFLLQRLAKLAAPLSVKSSAEIGIDPDWVEAMAFAWFAKNTLEKKPSNLPSVTGASRLAVLGGIYYA